MAISKLKPWFLNDTLFQSILQDVTSGAMSYLAYHSYVKGVSLGFYVVSGYYTPLPLMKQISVMSANFPFF